MKETTYLIIFLIYIIILYIYLKPNEEKMIFTIDNGKIIESKNCKNKKCMMCELEEKGKECKFEKMIEMKEKDMNIKMMISSKSTHFLKENKGKYEFEIEIIKIDGSFNKMNYLFQENVHEWEQGIIYINNIHSIKEMKITLLFSGHQGIIYFDEFKIIKYKKEEMNSLFILNQNPSFENGRIGWEELGYELDTNHFYSGKYSLKMTNLEETHQRYSHQLINIHQQSSRPILLFGYSKSLSVSGIKNSDYSIGLLLIFKNEKTKYEHIDIDIGTNDWKLIEYIIDTEEPIDKIRIFLNFKNKKGTVWFDDITLQECNSIHSCPKIPPRIWPFDMVYIFNNPLEIEKRNLMLNHLKSLGIPQKMIHFESIISNRYNKEMIMELLNSGIILNVCKKEYISTNFIIQYLFLRKIFEKSLKYSSILIIKDYLKFKDNSFYDHLSKIMKFIPSNWEMIHFYHHSPYQLKKYSEIFSIKEKENGLYSLQDSFMIKKNLFKNYLKIPLNFEEEKSYENHYYLNNPLFIQDDSWNDKIYHPNELGLNC